MGPQQRRCLLFSLQGGTQQIVSLHEVSSTPVDYSSLSFLIAVLIPQASTSRQLVNPSDNAENVPCPPTPVTTSTPPVVTTPPPVANPTTEPNLHASRKLTEGSCSYAEFIQSAKSHLEKLRASGRK